MSRAADPDVISNLIHVVELDGPSGYQTIDVEKGATVLNVSVAPGSWTITIKSYLDSISEYNLYYQGTRIVELIAGKNNDISISMNATELSPSYYGNLTNLEAWLARVSSDLPNSIPEPYAIKLDSSVDLDESFSGQTAWYKLLSILDANDNKFVSLDLSECVFAGTSFAPGAGNESIKANIVALTMPNQAKTIGNAFPTPYFGDYINLKSFTGRELTSIPAQAFNGLASLETVDLPKVETIGNSAFLGCTNLQTVYLPKTETIGDNTVGRTFEGCINLETITFSADLTSIPPSAFLGCERLETIDLSHVTYIGMNAFQYCEILSTIDIRNVTSFGTTPFDGCEGLISITIGANLTIGSAGFPTQFVSDYALSSHLGASIDKAAGTYVKQDDTLWNWYPLD
jgi:hypothetical protein